MTSIKLEDLRDDLDTERIVEKCRGFKCKLKLPLEEDSAICVKNTKQYKNDTNETTNAYYNLKSTLYNPIFRGQAYRLDSCFFTINRTKYQGQQYAGTKFDFMTKRLYLNETNNDTAGTGVIGEMVIVFVNANNSEINLNLIIPIFGSNTGSISGNKLIKQIKNADSVTDDSILKLNTYIPRKTNYYYLSSESDDSYIDDNSTIDASVKTRYKGKKYHNIIFKNSQISINQFEYIKAVLNQTNANAPGDGSTERYDSEFLRNSKISDTKEFEETQDNNVTIVKKLLLSNGIFDNMEETSIINCEPVDDNGMLLIDREKGLGESGITKTTSMEQLQKKYTEGAMAQLLLGAALIFLISSFFKSTLRLLDKDK